MGKQSPKETYQNRRQEHSAVFQGAGRVQNPAPYQSSNLAVQQGLMEIFDEFTEVIAGELNAMKLDDVNKQ